MDKRTEEMHAGYWWEKLWGEYHLEYPDVGERIKLKWIFKK
jgi:hypothetical protein